MNNFYQLKLRATNESLNAEGIADNAKLNIEIINLELFEKNLPLKLLSLKVIHGNSENNTMRRNPYNLTFNEKFDL